MVSPTFTLEMNWLILVRRHFDRWTHQHVGVSVAMGCIMIYIYILYYIYNIPICSHFLGKLMVNPMEVWSILCYNVQTGHDT